MARKGAAGSSGAGGVRAVSLSDVTAHIAPTSVTSPVSTAAKVTQAAPKTSALEPDVAFPAVLKGSQKQRVPPPVPPRGSPKAKRGGGHSQTTGHDTKGDYPTSNAPVSGETPRRPFAHSDGSPGFCGHVVKYKEISACRVRSPPPPPPSRHPRKAPKPVAPKYSDYVRDDSTPERSNSAKDLVAQTNMMAKFNIENVVREHLDSGDFDDLSFTETSDEEIVAVEVKDYGDDSDEEVAPKVKNSKNPLQFIMRQKRKIKPTPVVIDSPRESIDSPSPDLIPAKSPIGTIPPTKEPPKSPERGDPASKTSAKSSLMYGLSKKFNFNQSRKDRTRQEPSKIKPKIEIRTYSEEHSGGPKVDVCHKKAKTNIDMFQRSIAKMQTDSENSSRRSSISSVESSRARRPPTVRRRDIVSEARKIFESRPPAHNSRAPVEQKPYSPHATDVKPLVSRPVSGNVHDKIKRFTVIPVPETKAAARTVSPAAALPCCSTPPPPFEEAPPPRTSRTNSSSTTSSSASGRRRGASSAASVVTTSSASSLALTPALVSARSNEASVCWTPPASVEGSTPTWTEGTPSFTESSSSEQGYPITPARGATPSEGRRSPRAPPPPARMAPPTTINCLTSEVLHLKDKVEKDYK
ncbi:unnamed protein product, partial [Iphiclides podalirius]